MATNLPNKKIKQVKILDGSTIEIIPERLQNNGFEATLPELEHDVVIAAVENIPTKTSDITNDGNGDAEGVFTTKKYVDDLGDTKVDKVQGKSLSTNDFTDVLKTKLDNIAAGAQVNVIETVKVNGSALSVDNKAVDITVPTKTSDLTNDGEGKANCPYVTKEVNNLDNYTSTTEMTRLLGLKQDEITLENKLDYSLIDNAPLIPTKTSDLTNDSDFTTKTYVDETFVDKTSLQQIGGQKTFNGYTYFKYPRPALSDTTLGSSSEKFLTTYTVNISDGTNTLAVADIASKSDIPAIPDIQKGTTIGNGNAVTDIDVSGHTITLRKETTFLTEHQDITGKIDKVSSTDNAAVRFDGTTGSVQNSKVLIDDIGSINLTNVKATLSDGSKIQFTNTGNTINNSFGADTSKSFLWSVDGTNKLVLSTDSLKPGSDKLLSLGSALASWDNIYATTIYEGGSSLASKYQPVGPYLTQHQSIKTLDTTTNDDSLSTNANETIAGTGKINLHKVSKTGNYNDLNHLPTLGTAASKNVGTAEGTIPILGTGGKLPASVIPATVVTDVTLDGTSVLDGTVAKLTSPDLSNYVTLDTNQTITGNKTFTNVNFDSAYGNKIFNRDSTTGNQNYGLALPNTSSWTANKEIATVENTTPKLLTITSQRHLTSGEAKKCIGGIQVESDYYLNLGGGVLLKNPYITGISVTATTIDITAVGINPSSQMIFHKARLSLNASDDTVAVTERNITTRVLDNIATTDQAFNVIYVSEMTDSNHFSQAQIEQILNGKPTRVIGNINNQLNNVIFLSCYDDGTYLTVLFSYANSSIDKGISYVNITKSNGFCNIRNNKIRFGSNEVYISTDSGGQNTIYINGKKLPDYPTDLTKDYSLEQEKTTGNIVWKEKLPSRIKFNTRFSVENAWTEITDVDDLAILDYSFSEEERANIRIIAFNVDAGDNFEKNQMETTNISWGGQSSSYDVGKLRAFCHMYFSANNSSAIVIQFTKQTVDNVSKWGYYRRR